MAITERPYVGSWSLNNKQVIKHTPDVLVYINGDTAVPGCPSCNGRIDIQQFITSVSVDPSTSPMATGNISLQIPRHYGDSLLRDGQFILRPGLEIHIYMRGYFPVAGAFSDVSSSQTGGVDVSGAYVYPYYHVFHGVVTEVSHEYNGGEHTVTINLVDLLHFWQYQRLSTNGAAFGLKIENSKVRMSLMGNTFAGMTPYSIIYNLYRDIAGAAGGVDFALGNESNAAARSTTFQEGLWSMTINYWKKRFSEHMTSLRMYGVDGTLYNAFEQSFLSTKKAQSALLDVRLSDKTLQSVEERDPFLRLSRTLQGDPLSLLFSAESEADAAAGGAGVNVTEMHAIVSNLGDWGQVNFFETQYETKMEIINKVCEITGFEFYQDVDGDLVFKPPFYNLDTRASRAYVIRQIDVISLSSKEGEPEATVIKATSGQFKNLTGTSLEGEWGNRAEFIDFKLAAQFGWRQQTFETAYLTNPRAMFFACVNRMDVLNAPVNAATVTIPIRPELRPGYPVYIEHLDCFYYLQSFNHQFQFGGQCTTTLNLIAKRAKFYAPGIPPGDRKPDISDIKLDNTFLPVIPLQVVSDETGGIPRLMGFPNVVLALDPELINPLYTVIGDASILDDIRSQAGIDSIVRYAVFNNILTINDSQAAPDAKKALLEGPWVIKGSNDGTQDLKVESSTVLFQQAKTITSARDAAHSNPANQQKQDALLNAEEEFARSQLGIILRAVSGHMANARPDMVGTINALDMLGDLKAKFSPGRNLPGFYRYYSASHPDPFQQGAKIVSGTDQSTLKVGDLATLERPTNVYGFKDVGGDVVMGYNPVSVGLSIMVPGSKTPVPRSTDQITMLAFQEHIFTKNVPQPSLTNNEIPPFPVASAEKAIASRFRGVVAQAALPNQMTPRQLIESVYNEVKEIVSTSIAQVNPFNAAGLIEGIPTFDDALFEAMQTDGMYEPVDVDKSMDAMFKDTNVNSALYTMIGQAISPLTVISIAFKQRADDIQSQYGSTDLSISDMQNKINATRELRNALYNFLAQFPEYTSYKADKVGSGSVGRITYKNAKYNIKTYTPVFPVSDSVGYEVIGNYRYGRGLTIEEGGSFEQLTQMDRFEHANPDAVDEFIHNLITDKDGTKGLDVAGAFNAIQDPTLKAYLAFSAGLNTQEVINAGKVGGTMFERAFMAHMADTNQTPHKVSVTNAAYSLADLSGYVTKEVCSCKGSEADLYLQAFSGDFITITAEDQPDEVSGRLATDILNKVNGWRQAQDALRGTVLDTNTASLAEAVMAAGQVYGSLASTAQDAAATLNEQGQQLLEEE